MPWQIHGLSNKRHDENNMNKEKIGIILRSAAQFYALCFGYIIIRGVVLSSSNDSMQQLIYSGVALKFFLASGVFTILFALLYSFFSPIKSKPNYLIILPLLISFIILIEFFFFMIIDNILDSALGMLR